MKFQKEHLLLYAVTDRAWTGNGVTLADQVESALRGGATMVQLREKNISREEFENEARKILPICHAYGVPFIINDDVELAAKVSADGVHVGQKDMDPGRVREILGNDAIVGVTAKTVEQALAAEAAGADYLGSGAVFGSTTKTDAVPLDLDHFEKICRSVSIPVTAIGGINRDNIRQLAGRGMSGFAVVGGIFGAPDVEAAARELRGIAEELVPRDVRLSPEAAVFCRKIRERRPVVQCIANIVTAGDCANALLAIGASPTMAHHPDEMEDFAKISDALVLSMGATESLEAMFRAGRAEGAAGSRVRRPIVIDPVGCAASGFRRKKCWELIREVQPVCIRGNASEIKALVLDADTGRGVDDPEELRDTPAAEEDYVRRLSEMTGAIVIASGATDYIAKAGCVKEVTGGTTLFRHITGSGCMMSSLLGAFMSISPSIESAAACCELMAAAGEAAERWARRDCAALPGTGTGSFHTRFFDALSLL